MRLVLLTTALGRFPIELTLHFSSLPGLTRQSIFLGRSVLMDARVEPAHDESIRSGTALMSRFF